MKAKVWVGLVIAIWIPMGNIVAQPVNPVEPLVAARLSAQARVESTVPACAPPPGSHVHAVDGRSGQSVDACGRRLADTRDAMVAPMARPASDPDASRVAATIDRMSFRETADLATPGSSISLIGSADIYELSDGSQWASGAGSYYRHSVRLRTAAVDGTTVRYWLTPEQRGRIYEQEDYNGGNHSSRGTLAVTGDLVLEATVGSTVATIRGEARVIANDPSWYGEPRFNYFSSIPGSVVPFRIDVTLTGDTWDATTFERNFGYLSNGWVDFANPVSTPAPIELAIEGTSRIPDESATPFIARVGYPGGVQRDVTHAAQWSVDPSATASVAGGVVTVGALAEASAPLLLRASYQQDGVTVTAERAVRAYANLAADGSGLWPMFQANARHTGAVADALVPGQFGLRWQRSIHGATALNPVAAGDGKVFVTSRIYIQPAVVLALDARDGTTVWSKDFGSPFSVNPPAYAYGNVYVQTGNHGTDTWLHALDGETGERVFKAPHEAQWERYFAPTIDDGSVYVNGGAYGGMYAFNAFTGTRRWYAGLPQYDQWTPAVANGRVHAYVGSYSPGLFSGNAASGTPTTRIADDAFSWNGWSMNVAPVLGGNDDAIVTQSGRLISFDIALGTIRWQQAGNYVGQPSVAGGRLYVANGTRVSVLDPITQAELWSWQPPIGTPTGQMIVTARHLLASTADSVYAVDLETRQAVWSHPVGGHLALADDRLYVASSNGTLTAFAAPRDVILRSGFD